MLILTGNNLGERHQELNSKVIEAADGGTSFQEVVSQEEKCDVDKLFKIGLVSRYKNIDYLIEVLKCGDMFYITRALNCYWLYNDEYSDYINTNYLTENIFPYMSTKMKRKLLTTISIYLRNGERAIDFYTYCRNAKEIDYAYKFLVYTPDTFKLEIMKDEANLRSFRDSKFLKQLIGSSFVLAKAYIALRYSSNYVIHQLQFLYSVSNEEYLDLLENHSSVDERYPGGLTRFGRRISKHILNKHRARVLQHPVLYINKLNKEMLVRYLTIEDVRTLATKLLPYTSDYFWSMDFYNVYKYILVKIPASDLFSYLKIIFTSKYEGESFEMNIKFYNLKYYELLTIEEREAWALLHIERDEELPGIENYMWYKFVCFQNAFSGIKRNIFLTPDKHKRSRIVNILPETARNQDDLTKILSYYYERHANESEEYKESFVNKVIEHHDIYSFNSECWTSLDKLFYCLEVYTTAFYVKVEYKARSLFYHILHNKNIPDTLIEYIDYGHYYDIISIIGQLSKERNNIIAMYLMNYYADKIKLLMGRPCDTAADIETEIPRDTADNVKMEGPSDAVDEAHMETQCDAVDHVKIETPCDAVGDAKIETSCDDADDVQMLMETCDTADDDDDNSNKNKIMAEVDKVWNVIYTFNRVYEECPEIIKQFIQSNIENYQYHETFKPKFIKKTEGDFLRWLKQDKQLTIDGISEIRCNAYRWNFRLCRLFRKLKVYFPNDVGQEYLKHFTEYLSDLPKGRREYRNIKMAVVGVLYLADEEFKHNFIGKYVPENPKIDHMNIDNRLLQVQKAICRLAYHSRPPLTLSSFLKYVTGDYIHYCLPVFYNYLTNSTSLLKFIESVLNAPLSIRKHGLRFAFATYRPEALKPLIIDAWKKTKNVSLRTLLYETLFYRILKENEEAQKEIYDILKLYTSELNHDDHDDVYSLLVSDDLPDMFKGDFIETAWLSVSKLSQKSVDMNRKTSVINHMEKYIHLVQRQFMRVQIIDDLIHDLLDMKNLKIHYPESGVGYVVEAKWNLIARYIVSFRNKEEQQESLELLRAILTKLLNLWDLIDAVYNKYTSRKFVHDFIKLIKSKDPMNKETCAYMVPVYQCILDGLQKTLKKEEMYLIAWELKLAIACRIIIHGGKSGKRPSFSEIVRLFIKKVTKIVMDLVENKEFNYCNYQSVASIINNTGSTICSFFCYADDNFIYDAAMALADVKMNETHVLALLMLPIIPDRHWRGELKQALAKIKKLDSNEIRSLLYEKYVLVDFCVRDYV